MSESSSIVAMIAVLSSSNVFFVTSTLLTDRRYSSFSAAVLSFDEEGDTCAEGIDAHDTISASDNAQPISGTIFFIFFMMF